MRIVFAGSPAVAVPTLDHLVASGHEVVAVLTQPDARSGRGRTLRPSAVAARALELGLPVLRPERAAEATEEIAALSPDLGVVVAYGQLIRPALLAAPTHGWLNLHFSVLPRWRGAAPVQRALIAGNTETGSTVFRLVPELDAGPVFATSRTTITPDENAGDLLHRLAVDGGPLVEEAITRIAAGEQPVEQPSDGVTHAAKLTADDGHLDLSRPADELTRVVRGCTPAPGAWTTFRGDRFKVQRVSDADGDLGPGELAVGKNEVLVGTGTHPLRLDLVQPPGKRPMPAADWARGITFTDREALGA